MAQLPRGIRNNNFGNIEDGPFAQGLPGYVGTDGRFARFDTPEAGFGAHERLLDTYGRKHGLNTVGGVIGRWAPSSDGNDVNGYGNYVARQLGVGVNDTLDMSDPAMRQRLARAMANFENGEGPMRGVGTGTAPTAAPANPMQTAMAVNQGPMAQAFQQPSPDTFGERLGSFVADEGGGLQHSLQNAATWMMANDKPELLATLKRGTDKDHFGHVTTPDGDVYTLDKRTGRLSRAVKGDPQRKINEAADIENAKAVNELNKTMPTEAFKSQNALSKTAELRRLLSDPNVYTGTGGELVGDITKFGSNFGINVQGATNVDAIRSLSRELALQARNPAGGAGMPGALSDSDRKFLESMVSGLSNTREGNMLMLDAYEKVHKRNLEIEKMRQDYVAKNGRLDMNFYRLVSQHAQQNTLFADAPAAGGGNNPLRRGVRSIEVVQ